MSNTPVGNIKPKLDLSRISETARERFETPEMVANASGVGGDDIAEIKAQLADLTFEVPIKGKYDTSIILGRDRWGNGDISSGYGLQANTECAAIDIVVGRRSADKVFDLREATKVGRRVHPDFVHDAARIYISQKTDVDRNFGLPLGNSGLSETRSGIAIKADALRMVARESIKLVIGTDQNNSQRGSIQTKLGVELMAGDLEKCDKIVSIKETPEKQILEIEEGGMQPIPLGVNTVFALDQMIQKIDKLAGSVSTCGMILVNFFNAATMHMHPDGVNAYFGIPAMPSAEYTAAATAAVTELYQYTIADIDLFRKELTSYKANHLLPSGPYYINSRFHTLN